MNSAAPPSLERFILSGHELNLKLTQTDLDELLNCIYHCTVGLSCGFPDGGAAGGHGEGEAGAGVHEGQAIFHPAVSV